MYKTDLLKIKFPGKYLSPEKYFVHLTFSILITNKASIMEHNNSKFQIHPVKINIKAAY